MIDDITLRCIVGDLLEVIETKQLQSTSRRSSEAHRRLERYRQGLTNWLNYAGDLRQPETGPDQGAG